MLEFEKQHRYIGWHTDAAVAGSIFPFNVHASIFIAGLHAMEILEDIKEVLEVFQAHLFDTKVVNNEAELDGSSFVAPETKC